MVVRPSPGCPKTDGNQHPHPTTENHCVANRVRARQTWIPPTRRYRSPPTRTVNQELVVLIDAELHEHAQGDPPIWDMLGSVTKLNYDQAKRWHRGLKELGKK